MIRNFQNCAPISIQNGSWVWVSGDRNISTSVLLFIRIWVNSNMGFVWKSSAFYSRRCFFDFVSILGQREPKVAKLICFSKELFCKFLSFRVSKSYIWFFLYSSILYIFIAICLLKIAFVVSKWKWVEVSAGEHQLLS